METSELKIIIIIIIIINELSNEFIKQPFLFIIKQCIIYYKIRHTIIITILIIVMLSNVLLTIV